MDTKGSDPHEDQIKDDTDSPIDVGTSEDVFVFPASFAQKRFWFLDQFDPGSPFYNIPTAVRLRGEFDVDIFRKCLKEIGNRHETLRTTFSMMDGEPVQLISLHQELPVEYIDLEAIPNEHRETQRCELRVRKHANRLT